MDRNVIHYAFKDILCVYLFCQYMTFLVLQHSRGTWPIYRCFLFCCSIKKCDSPVRHVKKPEDSELFFSLFYPRLQWPFQKPKMETLYHTRPYFWLATPLHRPYISVI